MRIKTDIQTNCINTVICTQNPACSAGSSSSKRVPKRFRLLLAVLALLFLFSSQALAEETYVATLSLYAFGTSVSPSGDHGHCFLTIRNISSKTLNFLNFPIKKNQTISLSNFGDKTGFGGIHINRDMVQCKGKKCTVLSVRITKNQLDNLAKMTPKESYYHDGTGGVDLKDNLWHNCTTYSVKAWNTVVPEKYKISGSFLGIDAPKWVRNKMKKISGSKEETFYPTDQWEQTDIFYLTKSKELVPCYGLKAPVLTGKASASSVKLDWTHLPVTLYNGKKVVDQYIIRYWTNGNSSSAKMINNIKGKSYTINNLTAGKTYTFEVTATYQGSKKAYYFESTSQRISFYVGEESNKQYIYTVQQLKNVSKKLSGTYYLMNDLDLGSSNWKPIGTEETPFTGKFFGNGHKIYNLKITGKGNNCGLFGFLQRAYVTGLYVYGEITGASYVGGIAGQAGTGSKVSYCISDVVVHGEDQVGGIVGRVYESNVYYCLNKRHVFASGRCSGGIAADIYPSGSIKNCVNYGNVYGGYNLTGGIVGGCTAGPVISCFMVGNVGSGGGMTGAIAGDNSSYSGERRNNYFMKTSKCNSNYEPIGTNCGTFKSNSFKKLKDMVAKIYAEF